MLDGLMMDYPLTLTHFLERARHLYGHQQVVTRGADKAIFRYTYSEFEERSRRLMTALIKLGVKPGDRVATLAWNSHRHLEAYFGIPCMGAVAHTLNPRLHPDELTFIARQAQDEVVLVDASLMPVLDKFRSHVPSLRHVIVMPDGAPIPVIEPNLEYEALLAQSAPMVTMPRLEENSAAMLCYTSGTTGNPKGVLYSHRSSVLHALALCLRDCVGVAGSDTVLPVVPMFHAAAWGMVYAGVAMGAKIVLPGPHLDAHSLLGLIECERVTMAAGVPTIWLGILDALDREPGRYDLSSVRTTAVGGAAAPPSLITGLRDRHGIEVAHAWGMTEMSPVGTAARLKSHLVELPSDERLRYQITQGYPLIWVDHRHVDEQGEILEWDGETMGELEVRGPWVARAYYAGEGADRFTADGWFKTGDVVTIDKEGYVTITDRSKDVIKSGGEWISSVALENALMAHSAVLEAAVFAGRHPVWDERPLAAIVLREGRGVSSEELTAHLAGSFAKYCLPDEYLFLDSIPRTSTGKFFKSKLRDKYGEILMQTGKTP